MAEIDAELAKQGAVLVEERVLRRVIKADRKLRGIGLQVPHDRCYALPRERFAQYVAPDELAVEVTALPERVVAAAVHRDRLGTPEALTQLWRVMFHAKIHEAFEDLLATRALTVTAIRERINRIGQTEFDEIRSVLKQEDLLLPPVDDLAIYVEFVALYLELVYFAPAAVDRTFPALLARAAVDATIALDLDPAALLAAARPPGAPERPVIAAPLPEEAPRDDRVIVIGEAAQRVARKAADRARDRGNRSRAAILHYRGGVTAGAETDLDELARRLARALGADPDDVASRWATALAPVAAYAAGQRSLRFSAGARLLYDLQAACVVAEREVKVVDFFGWALSRGKRPIVRALPATREVRIAKRVHAAVAKVPTCGVPSEQLAKTLRELAALADANVRKAMRPRIEATLDEVDLHPRSLPERVAEKKLVDELLDRAVAIGRLSIGNLRDAISKNDLKVTDLTVDELRRGDQLLKSDRLLADKMDGVYRRGESYLRFLQKLSSVMFGTPVGRFFTLYLILPLLGSLAVIEGLQHMVGPLSHKLFGVEPQISTPGSLAGCAVFLFLVLHVAWFRRATVWVALKLWWVVRLVLFDLPLGVWRHPLVARALDSRPVRWVVRPAIPAAITWLVVPAELAVGPVPLRWPIAIAVLAAWAVIANSRFGRIVEERVTDWAVRSGRHLTTRIVPSVVRWILQVFVRLVELFDRGIYRVDEWLRFRSGQGRAVVIAKGVLGAIWFVITYVLRFYINLFVEPTVNPIKHFPVVTVAAKLIIPVIPSLLSGITSWTTPVFGPALAGGFAGFTVLVLPGLAGFLVWELKENWRLYRATRPKVVRAIAIGHHGESMVGFLKPGFHSGTIPKLYTKLRRAAWSSDERGVARQHAGLHHVEEAIEKFVDRQLVSMLNEAASFTATDLALAHVEIGSNRIQIELACPSIDPARARIRFEFQSGWLVASMPAVGWIAALDAPQRRIFEITLAGFYKLSGVELVREQLEHALRGGAATPPYDIADDGLLVWPGDGYDTEILYDLRSRKLAPAVRGATYDGAVPDLLAHHAVFGREPLYWSVWSTAWQQIVRGDPPMTLLVGPSLVPAPRTAAATPQAERVPA